MSSSSRPSVFRQAALDRLSSPEQLDERMEVTQPRAWLALAACGLLLLGALTWGVFGRIPTKIHGHGILLRGEHIYKIPALADGQLVDLRAAVGVTVKRGDTVALLRPLSSTPGVTAALLPVLAPHDGRILEVLAKPGDLLAPGRAIFSLEPAVGELEAVIYLDASQGKRVRAGMPLQLTPSTYQKSEYGYLVGTVKLVTDFPASREAMRTVLENDDLVAKFSQGGAPIALYATLTPDPKAPTGFRWSSSGGPPGEIRSGTLCTASVVIEERRPLGFVLPAFRELSDL